MKLLAALALIVLACTSAPAPAPVTATKQQVSDSPTKKTHEDLDAVAKQITENYQLVTTTSGSLDWAAPKFEATRNVCYVVVLRLGTGAAWGPGAQHGAVFVYEASVSGDATGAGVVGPGAVGALPCFCVAGTVTLQFRSLDAELRHESIGQGPYSLEVWGAPATTQLCPAEPG